MPPQLTEDEEEIYRIWLARWAPSSLLGPPDYHRDTTDESFTVDYHRLRQVFNFGAYAAYGSVLPTPLEQIAFAKDPLGIVPPYEWRGTWHALLDVSATLADPKGAIQSKLVNPAATPSPSSMDIQWLIERQLAAGYREGDRVGYPSEEP